MARCPSCGGQSARRSPAHPSFPFCSERCQQLDLSAWLRSDFVISTAISEDVIPLCEAGKQEVNPANDGIAISPDSLEDFLID